MKIRTILAALALGLAPAAAIAQPPAALDARQAVYELRIYYAMPGKLDALNARFRDHTLAMFKKHGITSVAYWNEIRTPEAPNGRVVYILAYPSREAREADWKDFGSDPEWVQARNASEANGKLVEKVDSIFMTMTDYSPALTLPR